jgi:hypothetical protein
VEKAVASKQQYGNSACATPKGSFSPPVKLIVLALYFYSSFKEAGEGQRQSKMKTFLI